MTGEIPESFLVRFEGNAGPLANLVVFLILRATKKNDYVIGPFVTTADGCIWLDRDLLRERMESIETASPMDYVGGLEGCNALDVVIEPKIELEARVQRAMEYYPESARVLESVIGNCSNGDYSLTRRIELPLVDAEILVSVN